MSTLWSDEFRDALNEDEGYTYSSEDDRKWDSGDYTAEECESTWDDDTPDFRRPGSITEKERELAAAWEAGSSSGTEKNKPWYKQIAHIFGWGHYAPQRILGYYNIYDAISYLIIGFVIDGTRLKMDGYDVRLWKGHYGLAGSGGEIGLYGPRGGSLNKGDLEKIGLKSTELKVFKNDGKLIGERKEQGSFWTTTFSVFKDHFVSRTNITTENTFTFNTAEAANNFRNSYGRAEEKANSYFFNHGSKVSLVDSNDPLSVTIQWGRK